jgi:hypothetical protein
VFLGNIGVHVLFGLAAVIVGALATLSNKRRGRHSSLGTMNFWCLFAVFATMSAVSFIRWAADYHLFVLGVLSFAAANFGRMPVRLRWREWPRLHLTGMGTSYVLMLTAFYVDNGPNLPVWRELPDLAFWVLPSAIGAPLILYALSGHPVVLAFDRASKSDSKPDF